MKRTFVFTVACAALMTAPALGDDIINTNGFESPDYVTGSLDGQHGWWGDWGGGGSEPMVVTAPDPVIGQQAVRLEIDTTQGAYSYIDIEVPDLIGLGYKYVTVSFDVYREDSAWLSNLWWWWWDLGEPTYGLQWDEANGNPGGTYPFGWVNGSAGMPTILDQYCTVKMDWDFNTGLADCYYNGDWVCQVAIIDITMLTGWSFQLSHDEASGTGGEVVWIDNFLITAATGNEFTLTAEPDPLIGGSNARFTATNGNPNTMTYLAYSLRGPGSTYVPQLNVTLDIARPSQAGNPVKSDAAGTAQWILKVPGSASGRNVWLQAAQFENTTNVVATSVK